MKNKDAAFILRSQQSAEHKQLRHAPYSPRQGSGASSGKSPDSHTARTSNEYALSCATTKGRHSAIEDTRQHYEIPGNPQQASQHPSRRVHMQEKGDRHVETLTHTWARTRACLATALASRSHSSNSSASMGCRSTSTTGTITPCCSSSTRASSIAVWPKLGGARCNKMGSQMNALQFSGWHWCALQPLNKQPGNVSTNLARLPGPLSRDFVAVFLLDVVRGHAHGALQSATRMQSGSVTHSHARVCDPTQFPSFIQHTHGTPQPQARHHQVRVSTTNTSYALPGDRHPRHKSNSCVCGRRGGPQVVRDCVYCGRANHGDCPTAEL